MNIFPTLFLVLLLLIEAASTKKTTGIRINKKSCSSEQRELISQALQDAITYANLGVQALDNLQEQPREFRNVLANLLAPKELWGNTPIPSEILQTTNLATIRNNLQAVADSIQSESVNVEFICPNEKMQTDDFCNSDIFGLTLNLRPDAQGNQQHGILFCEAAFGLVESIAKLPTITPGMEIWKISTIGTFVLHEWFHLVHRMPDAEYGYFKCAALPKSSPRLLTNLDGADFWGTPDNNPDSYALTTLILVDKVKDWDWSSGVARPISRSIRKP